MISTRGLLNIHFTKCYLRMQFLYLYVVIEKKNYVFYFRNSGRVAVHFVPVDSDGGAILHGG